jgi:xanthine dehydrogenase YagR molybdenum-binding subunit
MNWQKELGMDPIELRIRNEPEKDPTSGTPFLFAPHRGSVQDRAERFGWAGRRAKPGTCTAKGEWLVGMGCATATYPYYRMPVASRASRLTKDGRATVEIAAHEMGMGTQLRRPMVTAERLGLAMERVTVNYGDSHFPGVVLAGGSQQTASIGGFGGRCASRAHN